MSGFIQHLKDSPRTQAYIHRLTQEWKEHGKIIIALDFDDTISPWKFQQKEWFDKVISLVRACQDTKEKINAILSV